ncbi:GNAT family N-acetyltransferase [Litoreibacter janthinus]|uniref:L-amino acid N-acyltransferase YncA n=1 Tax=Litoreibacter janthinus TaxID=670154 RepID=A0A1I6G9L9_9RHOB|nr:GNAT family N-acetyltransferase [Litoreibacter janthinus]SFR38865.1 L-amino acid N-acyltransferase YncA [Litoreibacter janthinus]
MIVFREAELADIAAVLALLKDDSLGAAREVDSLSEYLEAFRQMTAEGNNHLIVGEIDGRIVATYQITYISGLSLKAARRAQIESVRISSDLRRQGLGRLMFDDAAKRAKEAGCSLMQLTMNASRQDSAKFYGSVGFTPSHIGYKREL